MSIPQLDLQAQYRAIKPELDEAVSRVLASGHFIMGPEVQAFEQEVAQHCAVKHAIGVASGTDALLLSLRALGVGPGDAVLIPSFTFFATAGTVCNVGATPVFVDIDPATYNMDPADVKKRLNGKLPGQPKAIIPVHLYGQMAEMEALQRIAQKHGLFVIEDAAQAIGATSKGKQAGTLGHTGCFSFFPSKNLGACGDGGMVITSDDALAEKIRILRVHGSKPKYYHTVVGYNSRLDALQAAILRVKLKHLNAWSKARQEKADRYNALLKGVSGVQTPCVTQGNSHIYHQYTIRVGAEKRDALAAHLKEGGIDTAVYYPLGLHLQECFQNLGYGKGDLPHTEAASEDVLSLPIYPELDEQQIKMVVASIAEFMTS